MLCYRAETMKENEIIQVSPPKKNQSSGSLSCINVLNLLNHNQTFENQIKNVICEGQTFYSILPVR